MVVSDAKHWNLPIGEAPGLDGSETAGMRDFWSKYFADSDGDDEQSKEGMLKIDLDDGVTCLAVRKSDRMLAFGGASLQIYDSVTAESEHKLWFSCTPSSQALSVAQGAHHQTSEEADFTCRVDPEVTTMLLLLLLSLLLVLVLLPLWRLLLPLISLSLTSLLQLPLFALEKQAPGHDANEEAERIEATISCLQWAPPSKAKDGAEATIMVGLRSVNTVHPPNGIAEGSYDVVNSAVVALALSGSGDSAEWEIAYSVCAASAIVPIGTGDNHRAAANTPLEIHFPGVEPGLFCVLHRGHLGHFDIRSDPRYIDPSLL